MLVIAMLALSVAAPRFSALLPGLTLKAETQKTAALLRHLRSRAIATGEPQRLEWDPDQHLIWVNRQPHHALPEGIQLDLADEEEQKTGLIFYPDGTAAGSGLSLSSGDQRYEIQLNWLTGRISVHG
ncbi:GspH/FimT family pseudopilin [Gallaecimonas sp. GXIMD4217]|uniref:GspH/FimT family pseudopilin n=1 Tax=Gallaecimonas sp. GXIMD4217 TaxID=3131927 RepID=UPI00311AE432